jgi:hypothetical protein
VGITRRLGLALCCGALSSGCGAHQVTAATLEPVFGPVVPTEVISGRAVDGGPGVTLMVGGTTLVHVDLETRTHRDTRVLLPDAERCWGLARLSDGAVWTLKGRDAAIRIGEDGRVLQTLPLGSPHFGLFGVADRLIVQPAAVAAGGAALVSNRPGDVHRIPWGDLVVRSFDQFASGAAAALNLVSCGVGGAGEVPCWFPDEPVVSLIRADGSARRIELAGLPRVAPEQLINASAPARPIRDVFIEVDGTIWVLSTGKPLDAAKDTPGGWLLARYGRSGEPIDRRALPEPVRLVLRAGGGRALVLTGLGMVAEVLP